MFFSVYFFILKISFYELFKIINLIVIWNFIDNQFGQFKTSNQIIFEKSMLSIYETRLAYLYNDSFLVIYVVRK